MERKFYQRHAFFCTSGKTCPQKAPVEDLIGFFRQEIKKRGLNKEIRVNKSGCLDWCQEGPVMVVYPEGVWYAGLKAEDLPEILEEHLINGRPVERLVARREG